MSIIRFGVEILRLYVFVVSRLLNEDLEQTVKQFAAAFHISYLSNSQLKSLITIRVMRLTGSGGGGLGPIMAARVAPISESRVKGMVSRY